MLIDLSPGAIRAVGLVFYLIGLLALVCIVRTFGYPDARKFIFLSVPVFAFCSFASCVVHVYSITENAPTPVALKGGVARLLSLPVWAVAAAAALGLAFIVVSLARLEKTIGRELSAQSVCEGIDQLPDGICVSLKNGFPRLVNDQMQKISNAAFGVGVLDTKRLDEKLERRAFQPGCRLEERDGNQFLCLPDGGVWQIKRQSITADGRELTETIAYDVTERYNNLLELEKRNARLAEVNRQLHDVLGNMNRIVREKEILSARIRLHNDLGHCLLMLENYMLHGGERETVMRELSDTVEMLWDKQSDAHTEDRMFALFEAAKAVGVEIRLQGELPGQWKELIEIAILECLTNTVKHAKGKTLNVSFADDGAFDTVVLTNDGDPPKGVVHETGGLASLRTLAGRQGAEMTVESEPAFRLTLRLPKQGPADGSLTFSGQSAEGGFS